MKKYYEVRLISTTVQTKIVLAESPEQAEQLANDDDWMGKEVIIDSETSAEEIPAEEAKGRIVVGAD